MSSPLHKIRLNDAAATATLARHIAPRLRRGDTLLLQGSIGAGKTTFARALIRARLGYEEDVPSPTFTLVQTYPAPGGDIWHCDLYRLTDTQEVMELGLDDALSDAICLIEWPDRLGPDQPDTALLCNFEAMGDHHILTLHGSGSWQERLADLATYRSDVRRAFLSETPWVDWTAATVAGDASSRSYQRLTGPDGESVILMDADPAAGEKTAHFIAIARWLTDHALTAPEILRADTVNGFIVMDDLGPTTLAAAKAPEDALYDAAVDVLIALDDMVPPALQRMTPEIAGNMVTITAEYYHACNPAPVAAAVRDALQAHAPQANRIALRDYHAENLIWRPDRAGLDRIGLLDFQDAFLAPSGYDLASLLRDVRRTVSPAQIDRQIARFAVGIGADREMIGRRVAVLAAQRNLRILGVFARLSRHGKPRYATLLPRVWDTLMLDLAHPALADLRKIVLRDLPPPDRARL